MPAYKVPRPPKSFLGVTIAADVAVALARFCGLHGLSKSAYTELALRRSLAADAAVTPATPSPPTPTSPTTTKEMP